MTKIEWTDVTWNPIAGCSPVSPGCTHCYAATMARRLEAMGQEKYKGLAERRGSVDVFTGKLSVDVGAALAPLRWKTPRRVFVNSMSDLFHEAVPNDLLDQIFSTMALRPQHTFQVLTKRPKRMREYCAAAPWFAKYVTVGFAQTGRLLTEGTISHQVLPNVWLGVSVEDQQRADERIPDLVATPAAVRFLSIEPLLGPIDLEVLREAAGLIDWVIVGGESGPGARPMHPDWVRSIRDQCQAAGVPFFFKQWGEWIVPFDVHGTCEPACVVCGCTENHACDNGCLWISDPEHDRCSNCLGRPIPSERAVKFHRVGKKRAGRVLDGRTWDEFPKPLA